MTAAHEHRISDRRRLRLQSLCEVRRQKMPKKRQQQWWAIQGVICGCSQQHMFSAPVTLHFRAESLVEKWKRDCESVGIGTGWLAFLFWRFFLPILIQLAKEWLEAEETSQVTISGVAMGSAEGRA